MKNDKKIFITIEVALAVMVLVLSLFMIQGKNGKDHSKISVILQNPDEHRWDAFKYGLKMAAADQKMEMFVISMAPQQSAEEVKNIMEREIANGADAVIIQPVPGDDMAKVLKKMQKRIPVIQVEDKVSEKKKNSWIPVVEPDNYAMGAALAEELLKDFNGKLDGKKIGIFSESEESEAVKERKQGFRDGVKGSGAEIVWSVSQAFTENREMALEKQSKVNIVAALDDNSLVTAGEAAAAKNLHGAVIYGIGNSTDAVYYLDTGFAECLVVPDEFNVGYQSLIEAAAFLNNLRPSGTKRTVSHTVIRRETLFSKENQEILFTMSQ